MNDATIRRVQIAAAHDGDAELVVTLAYENGGESLVTLDEFAARSLLASCGTTQPDELIGQSWVRVRDALVASSGRFDETQDTEN